MTALIAESLRSNTMEHHLKTHREGAMVWGGTWSLSSKALQQAQDFLHLHFLYILFHATISLTEQLGALQKA